MDVVKGDTTFDLRQGLSLIQNFGLTLDDFEDAFAGADPRHDVAPEAAEAAGTDGDDHEVHQELRHIADGESAKDHLAATVPEYEAHRTEADDHGDGHKLGDGADALGRHG